MWMGVCRPLLSVNRSLVYVGAGPHLLAVETDSGKKVGATCMHMGDVERIGKANRRLCVCSLGWVSVGRSGGKSGAADSRLDHL